MCGAVSHLGHRQHSLICSSKGHWSSRRPSEGESWSITVQKHEFSREHHQTQSKGWTWLEGTWELCQTCVWKPHSPPGLWWTQCPAHTSGRAVGLRCGECREAGATAETAAISAGEVTQWGPFSAISFGWSLLFAPFSEMYWVRWPQHKALNKWAERGSLFLPHTLTPGKCWHMGHKSKISLVISPERHRPYSTLISLPPLQTFPVPRILPVCASSGAANWIPSYHNNHLWQQEVFCSFPPTFQGTAQGKVAAARNKSITASYVLFTSGIFITCMRKVPSKVWRWTFQRGKLVPRQAFKAKEYCAGFILGWFLINCSSLLCLDHSIGSFV